MILVDFSGTLAKHREATKQLFEGVEMEFFRKHGFKGTEEELKQAMREANRRLRSREAKRGDLTLEVAKQLGLEIPEEEAIEKEKLFDEKYVEIIEPVEGALEGLRKLVKLSDLVILTNGTCRRVIPVIEKFGMEGFFKQIICLGGTGQNKNSEEIFRKMRRLGAWAIIGDNPAKDGLAERFGITFIDVRVGWPTVVNMVRSLDREKYRLRG